MSDFEPNDISQDAGGSNPAEVSGVQSATVSNQRLRAILAGLVTIAILAVLAIAVFSDNGDDDTALPPVATTAPSDGTGGDEGNNDTVVETPGDEELGSLAVSAFLCPEVTSEESACLDAGPVPIDSAVVKLADGRTYSLEGVEMGEDGMYAWLNIPIGEYTLLAEGLAGPEGSVPRTVIGSNGQNAEGWIVANLDPNQPAEVRIIFTPAGDGTPVG